MLRDSTPPRRRTRHAPRRPARLIAVGAVVAATTASCGAPLPDLEPGVSPSAYSGLAVDEDRIGYAIDNVEDIVTEEMEAADIPGAAVAVVHGGEVAYSAGFGVRSTENSEDGDNGDEVDTDTVFPLASLSTPVSATVVAAETARGEVGWSTPVQEYLPWFDLSDPRISPMVTVGDLFAHRSGLPEHAGADLSALGYDRPTVLHGLRHLPVEAFRDSHAYTGFGLTAGAEAVAVSAGTGWAELAHERVLAPLGMQDSSYSHEELADRSNRAVSHVRPGTGSGAGTSSGVADTTGPSDAASASSDAASGSSDAWVPASADRDPGARAPALGLSSSAADMARWMTMVLGDGTSSAGAEVVPVEALREALTPQVTSAPPGSAAERTGSYGYGFTISDSSSGRVQWSHSESFQPGSDAAMLMMPSLDLGIITLTNASPVGAAQKVNSRFADLAQYGDPAVDWGQLYDQRFTPVHAPEGDLATEQPPVEPESSRPVDELVGTYRSDHFGELHVRRDGDELLAEFGRDQDPWPLEHWDGDTFAVSPVGGNWPAGTRASVIFDDDEVTLTLLDGHGLGTFTRVAPDDAQD